MGIDIFVDGPASVYVMIMQKQGTSFRSIFSDFGEIWVAEWLPLLTFDHEVWVPVSLEAKFSS